MSFEPNFINTNNYWSRNRLIKILTAALEIEQFRFVNQVCLLWLAAYPGDLPVRLLHAKALAAEGLGTQSIRILENLVQADPEFLEAQSMLSQLYGDEEKRRKSIALGCAYALGNNEKLTDLVPKTIPKWSYTLAKARIKSRIGEKEKDPLEFDLLMREVSDLPLTAITHLLMLRKLEDNQQAAIFDLSQHYHERWPECLQFSIILAEALIARGEPEMAVALLHKAASKDVTGQVVNRIFGEKHAYKDLWPQKMMAVIDVQIPFSVIAHLGWNLVTPQANSISKENNLGNPQTPNKQPLKAAAIHDEAHVTSELRSSCQEKNDEQTKEKTRPKRGKNAKGLFPVYVIYTTRQGLVNKYGPATTLEIEKSMRGLVLTLRKRLTWGAVLIYADDPKCMAEFGLKPAQSTDPWKLKLALADLDQALGERGAKIGALLIVGGPEVVPFHHLPNPTDDADLHVPSDNPYATRDENYFIPEWPIGRLPGGMGTDPGLLISSIRRITKAHEDQIKNNQGKFRNFIEWLLTLFLPKRNYQNSSFGFTAEAWRKASGIVYRPIGDPKSLVTSPPVEISSRRVLPSSELGYFNLHGISDSPEWFGQKKPIAKGIDQEYPVALHPKSLTNGCKIPRIIFTEACYGAHIHEKTVDDALALKFLASGAQALIGSTVISYGSVTSPLNAADLLCKGFWDYLKAGYEVGEALHRAKIFLVSEMHRRQGYLDGEDQKTLISFVLFGDPLLKVNTRIFTKSRKIADPCPTLPDDVFTICDRIDNPGSSEPIPKEYLENIKEFVELYLPGMSNAKLALSHNHENCSSDGHECPTSQIRKEQKHSQIPPRHVITLSKQIVHGQISHESYARLTIDDDGKVIKLAVSK